MRCEHCGREMDNAQLWQLGADPKAPPAWSMRVLCWDCRQHPESATVPAAVAMSPVVTVSDEAQREASPA
ncbi:MAG: hypothetical protein ACHQ4H_12460 [Ktedonobacterales bacterium]|jgi:hypothetical protein